MAQFRVALGEDRLRVWRETSNILNKQSRTAEKGRSSRSGLKPQLLTVETYHRIGYKASYFDTLASYSEGVTQAEGV